MSRAEARARYYAAHGDEIRARNRESMRLNGRRWKYGLTNEAYDALLESQGGTCANASCSETSGLVIDHDHACCPGKGSCGLCVRALLCGPCNRALGHAREDAARLRGLADLLDSWGNR